MSYLASKEAYEVLFQHFCAANDLQLDKNIPHKEFLAAVTSDLFKLISGYDVIDLMERELLATAIQQRMREFKERLC